jgi:hypothetical protein
MPRIADGKFGGYDLAEQIRVDVASEFALGNGAAAKSP